MKIAFITPWPPQKTGIGDFALDLISDLLEFELLIHVYTDCAEPKQIAGAMFFNLNSCDRSQLNDYDLIIYQMGNNVHFHLYMLDIIREYPGIVHLHDMVLHHLMGWITWMRGDVQSYLLLLRKWYGPKISFLCHEMMKRNAMPWDTEIVTDLPLFEEFLQHAQGCIVNSEFAKFKVKQVFPDLPVYRIVHVLKGMNIVEKDYQTCRIPLNFGVFGGIEPNKNVDKILKTFSKLNQSRSDWLLHIVGEVGDKCRHIPELPAKLGIDDKVIFHGRLEDNDFKKCLSEMDLIISLRFPTMGKLPVWSLSHANGNSSDCQQIGWYAELPGFVNKVKIEGLEYNLLKILQKYINNNKNISKKKKEFVQYSKEHLDVKNIVTDYLGILKKEFTKRLNGGIIQRSADLLVDLEIHDDTLMNNFAKEIAPLIE